MEYFVFSRTQKVGCWADGLKEAALYLADGDVDLIHTNRHGTLMDTIAQTDNFQFGDVLPDSGEDAKEEGRTPNARPAEE